jgi:hypothetical protein
MSEPVRKPEARFQAGGVSASVFVNEAKRNDGSVFLSRKTVIQRTYVDAAGKYQSTSSMDVGDLPRAILVLIQAYAHCVVGGRNDPPTDDGQS